MNVCLRIHLYSVIVSEAVGADHLAGDTRGDWRQYRHQMTTDHNVRRGHVPVGLTAQTSLIDGPHSSPAPG
jgi:hypothetical protein